MTILIWCVVFVAALAVLVKGADWLLVSAEKIGLALGLSSFIVGAVIVGAGTSLPELFSSIVAVLQGVPDIPIANAVGSNIANILLVAGLSAVIGGKLMVTKNLINLDIPLLATGTALFAILAYDGSVTPAESIVLIAGYIVYILYTVLHKEDDGDWEVPELPSRETRRGHIAKKHARERSAAPRPKITGKDIVMLIIGILGLILGAKYLIESVIQLSTIFNIGTGVIAITAVAVGTSLPEILVSAKAALNKQSEVALGNVFGSNVFNMLIVVGLPGLFTTLPVDEKTLLVGIPTMVIATLLFTISGISRRVYLWEGLMYLLVYFVFIGKLFGIL